MAESQDRRAFLKRSAAAVSAAAVGCGPSGNEGAAAETGRALPPELLRAVAAVALPSELGEDGTERVTAAFETWLAEYRPVAEQVHGYGSQEIRYGPPDPAPRWRAQLAALEREARARHSTGFADLDRETRRALIEAALAGGGETALPDRPGALRAEHVAVGLAGWFFGSPEATNLCYGRRIDPGLCRPLSASPDLPTPLASVDDTRSTRLAAGARGRAVPDPAAAPERGLEPGS